MQTLDELNAKSEEIFSNGCINKIKSCINKDKLDAARKLGLNLQISAISYNTRLEMAEELGLSRIEDKECIKLMTGEYPTIVKKTERVSFPFYNDLNDKESSWSCSVKEYIKTKKIIGEIS